MSEDSLPARPRSAFAGTGHAAVGKDGRQLGGCTTEEFHGEYWTEERREEQRQRARELIAQGRFGAANGFHRRRTKKFQEVAAEHAQERASDIITKLDEIIFNRDRRANAQDILRAIEMYGKFEDWAVKNAREDEKDFRKMTNEQLNSRLLEMLGEAVGIDLSVLTEPAIDGEAVEVADDE